MEDHPILPPHTEFAREKVKLFKLGVKTGNNCGKGIFSETAEKPCSG